MYFGRKKKPCPKLHVQLIIIIVKKNTDFFQCIFLVVIYFATD